jgi:hypothetical protein
MLSCFREATKYIIGLLTPLNSDEQGQWLEKLIDVIQKQGLLNSSTVEKSHVEKAAKVYSFYVILIILSYFNLI